jgi:hypothetical protein
VLARLGLLGVLVGVPASIALAIMIANASDTRHQNGSGLSRLGLVLLSLLAIGLFAMVIGSMMDSAGVDFSALNSSDEFGLIQSLNLFLSSMGLASVLVAVVSGVILALLSRPGPPS